MANELYEDMQKQNNPYGIDRNTLMGKLQELSNTIGGNPNQIIQNLLNSGKVSQAQYNDVVNKANAISRFFGI